MSLTLLVASPGVGLGVARRRLEALDRERGQVATRDVEETLLDGRPETIQLFLQRRSRSRILDEWGSAFESALGELLRSDREHKVLSFHPSLFDRNRTEFISTVNRALQGLEKCGASVDRVVLLIDDIYDMFYRLNKTRKDLFFFDEWHDQRMVARDIVWDSIRLEDRPALYAESLLSILSQILNWRHFDMLAAESLSPEGELTVLGVKHPRESLHLLIVNPQVQTSYLSHPISRPRRAHRKTGVWPEVVEQSNDLALQGLRAGVVVVCPTAIDEYRIVRAAEDAESVFDRKLRLGARWLLIGGATEDLIAVTEDPSDLAEVLNRFGDGESPDFLLGRYAGILEGMVSLEVPFRDYFLVHHTDHFIVHRPLYDSRSFSDGVAAEIDAWRRLSKETGSSRRALFVHTFMDLRHALGVDVDTPVDSLPGWRDSLTSKVRSYLENSLLADEYPIECFGYVFAGVEPPASLLLARPMDVETVLKYRNDAIRRASMDVIFRNLTRLSLDEFQGNPNLAVLLSERERISTGLIEQAFDFVASGHWPVETSRDGMDRVELALGMTYEEWGGLVMASEPTPGAAPPP